MSIALTWNVLVCFMCRSVPMECMATLQGFLSGTYFGLGQGVGTLISGFLISSYGVSMTFYAFAVAILCYSVVFVTIFKVLYYIQCTFVPLLSCRCSLFDRQHNNVTLITLITITLIPITFIFTFISTNNFHK